MIAKVLGGSVVMLVACMLHVFGASMSKNTLLGSDGNYCNANTSEAEGCPLITFINDVNQPVTLSCGTNYSVMVTEQNGIEVIKAYGTDYTRECTKYEGCARKTSVKLLDSPPCIKRNQGSPIPAPAQPAPVSPPMK